MTVTQTCPVKQGGGVAHRTWTVDLASAACLAGITRERLAAEAQDMATHFPRWLLTLVSDGQPVRCKGCEGLYVFDAGLKCVGCGKPPRDTRQMRAGWFGVMPPIGLDGLAKLRDAIIAKPPPRHVVGQRDGLGTYILVPLVVWYPPGYPDVPLEVLYLPEFRKIPGVPRDEYSHAFHMIGTGRMCLFASGEWHDRMTCREVLQQRAYAHVIKFLNYANGKKDAFAIVTR